MIIYPEITSPSNTREDEEAKLNMNEPEPESDSDEDDATLPSEEHQIPIFHQEPLPTARRNRPSQQVEAQDAPMSVDPNPYNSLKCKGNVTDVEAEGLGKRYDASNEGMRPISSPFPRFL